jgi:apolipoprotein N-acyltransferase
LNGFQLGVALTGGVLMGITPAPVEAWGLAWIALVPLWVLVVNAAKQQHPYKSAIALAVAWGFGYHGLALFWVTGVHPMTWMGVPWLASVAIALFCWLFITFWGVALVTSWSLGMVFLEKAKAKKTRANDSLLVLTRVLAGVALWCGLEAFWGLGALYWTSLSYTQSPHNLVILHLGQLSGPMTVTAALVAVNGLLAEAWIRYQELRLRGLKSENSPLKFVEKPTTLVMVATGLLIVLHLMGLGLYSRALAQSPETALKVGIIQGNIPNTIKLYDEGRRRAITNYTNGYRTLADQGVDAVLTPEGALPFFQSKLRGSDFVSAVREKGVVAWLGAFGEQGNSYTNSLFTIASDGEIFSRYNKVKLVPIGEYVPFERVLGMIIQRLSPLEEHQTAGLPDQVFETPFGRVIVGICYESAFASHFRAQAARGGEFILTASNNAHYSQAMPAQHHAQDVMRAIETDRWAVRATNTGYSGVVDPHGRTVWMSDINTYEIHADTVYRRNTRTLYVGWGDWLTPVLGVSALGCWVVFYRR